MDGKSWGLLGVLRDHRGVVEYDFRTRFGVGLNIIGRGMSLSEAARLVEIIRADPSSALAAEIEGWAHPVSREAAVLMDLWDLTAIATGTKRPPRYERPWKQKGESSRHGDASGRTPDEVKALLRQARLGHAEAPV